MADTVTASPVCDICGAEIRDEAEFCYNCGGSLANVKEPVAGQGVAEAGDVVPGESSEQTVQLPGSANGIRERNRRTRPKPERAPRKHEMVWEEPSTGVSPVLLIGTAVFLLLTLGLLIAAYFIR